jgi:hypothetical protein
MDLLYPIEFKYYEKPSLIASVRKVFSNILWGTPIMPEGIFAIGI